MRLPRVLFVLPAKGGGGGANSVVQEAVGLRALGCPIAIAVNRKNVAAFAENYPELDALELPVHGFDSVEELAHAGRKDDVIVATTNGSVADVAAAAGIVARGGRPIKAAYYVQDYEPLFYDPTHILWKPAYDSYALMPGMGLFAKTDWLCDIVYANHGVRVAKVRPSIDHSIFFPDLSRSRGKLSIIAMLRPQTPRRAPHRTARIISALAEELSGRVSFSVFGATDEQLAGAGVALPESVINLGPLRRTAVPDLMRDADMFLDLSDYQAFGRTGLEGMACGCVPLLPVFGGGGEYAVDRRNAFVVDTRSDADILGAVRAFAGLSLREVDELRFAGIETAARYSIARTAVDELRFFQALVG